MSDQQAHADNLRASRAETLKNSARKAKKNIQAAMNGVSLMAHIDPFMDWLFAIALMAAMLKDILDIINNALIAAGGIGAALIFLLTIMTSLVIGFVMILTGSTGKTKVAKTIAKRITILILATIAELVPGVDILPLETLVVIIIVWMTLVERKVNADAERETSIEASRQAPTKKINQNPNLTTTTAEKLA